MKVLIVDDDIGMVKLLAAFVEYCGHDSAYALDGASALERFQESAPDLVLMDIIMPLVDGVAAARRIIDLDPDADIAFITAMGDYPTDMPADLRERAAILSKPVTLARLRTLLEAAESRQTSR